MNLFDITREFVEEVFGSQDITRYFDRCVYWVERLYPDADDAMLIAAIAGEINGAYYGTSYHNSKKAMTGLNSLKRIKQHRQESARIVNDFLSRHSASEDLISRVHDLIVGYDDGLDREYEVLRNANSMAYFETRAIPFIRTFTPMIGKKDVAETLLRIANQAESSEIKDDIRLMYENAKYELEKFVVKISVVVLTFNSEKYLPDLLESLSKTDWPECEWEIIFVDNDSKDRTLEILENTDYHVIRNEKNLGFAEGNNVGIRYALHKGSDYVVLLNDDTVVTESWIQEMYFAHKQYEDAGAVQPLLLYWDDKDKVNSWGNYIHFLGFGFAGGNLQSRKQLEDRPRIYPVSYCSGAAVMYSGNALKKAGLFDKTLESYHEDLDIALKMRLYGYRAYTTLNAIVYHKYKFLKSNKSLKGNYKYYLMERNRIVTLLRYYKFRTLCLIFPMWLVMEIGTFSFSIFRGFWKSKVKAYVWVARNWDYIMEERGLVKRLRRDHKISEYEFAEDFVSEISFQEIDNPILKYIGNPITKVYWEFVKTLLK